MSTTAPAASKARRARTAALADRLYSKHRTGLLAMARRNSASLEDAEEALQDAFILFIDHFDPASKAPPLAWLRLTLKRRCWALYRQQRRQPRVRYEDGAEELGDPRRSPEEMAEADDAIAGARQRLAVLKLAEREALGLFALGYSYREIGELTGWTYTKVNRCIAEGRATLHGLEADDRAVRESA